MKKSKQPIFNLDAEEQELSDAFDRGEFRSVKNIKKEKAKVQEAARNYLSKDAKINIRISTADLLQLKQIAAHEGLPYQTLIGSVLHKFAAGHL